MKFFNLLIATSLLLACTNDPNFPIETELPYHFQDGFETNNQELNDLFPADGSRWTGLQKVDPDNGENEIKLNQSTFNEGKSSLEIISKPSDNILSKMDIEKGGFYAPIGSTISIQADFYISSTGDLKDLFLIDLECCACWDNSVPNNQCPGIRLKFSGEDDFLSIERGKILGSTIAQAALSFPKDEWVRIEWRIQLAPDEEGKNFLAINGQEVINAAGKNMPNKDEFRAEFASNGIDFELREPLAYERIQIGATANPTTTEFRILIDNVVLRIE